MMKIPGPSGDLKPNDIAKADRSHPTPARSFCLDVPFRHICNQIPQLLFVQL